MVKFKNVDKANKCINKIVEMMKNYYYVDTSDYEDMFSRILFILDEITVEDIINDSFVTIDEISQLIKFKGELK